MNRPHAGPQILTPEVLVRAYGAGVFPMSEARDDPRVFWVDPEERGILPLDTFHVPRSLKKVVRKGVFDVYVDTDFPAVIKACSEPRPQTLDDMATGEEAGGTWINQTIEEAYIEMARLGLAHSVECWQDGELVGGLYGICLKGAFFGESMFSRRTNASKVALVHLVASLKAGGFSLLDTQFVTSHLERFGAIEIPDDDYHARLSAAFQIDAEFPKTVSAEGLEAAMRG